MSNKSLPDIVRRAESMMPVRRFNLHNYTNVADSGHVTELSHEVFFQEPFSNPDDDDQDNEALDAVECLRFCSSDPSGCSGSHWVGMIHPDAYGSRGLAHRPGRSLINGMGAGGITWQSSSGGITLAHELGHNYGRQHVDCAGNPDNPPDDPDPNYPFPVCWFGDGTKTGNYGYDIISKRAVRPVNAGDVMSYANNHWPSSYTWNVEYLLMLPFLAHHSAEDGAEDVIFVSGKVNPENGTADFSWFYELPAEAWDDERVLAAQDASAAEAQAPNPLKFLLLDDRGNLLSESALPLAHVDNGGGNVGFTHFVPSHEGVAAIRLVRGVQVFAERPVSRNRPEVSLGALDPGPRRADHSHRLGRVGCRRRPAGFPGAIQPGQWKSMVQLPSQLREYLGHAQYASLAGRRSGQSPNRGHGRSAGIGRGFGGVYPSQSLSDFDDLRRRGGTTPPPRKPSAALRAGTRCGRRP